MQTKLYHLHRKVYTSTSTVVPATPERFSQAEWLAATVEDDAVIPEAFFIAVKDDAFVGFGNLFRGEVEGELETGTFGTRRSYHHHHREVMLAIKNQRVKLLPVTVLQGLEPDVVRFCPSVIALALSNF